MQNIEKICIGNIIANEANDSGPLSTKLGNATNMNKEIKTMYTTGMNKKTLNFIKFIGVSIGSFLYRFVPSA